MELERLAAQYVAARNEERPLGNELSPQTERHLLESVRSYSKWLQRTATSNDFQPEQVNRYLAGLLAQGRSPWGVKNRRTGLLVLWRYAKREGLTGTDPGLVRRVHTPELPIDGYDVDAMRLLLEHARKLGGTIRYTGIKRAIYWESFLRLKWELGLRIGDMIRIKAADYNNGWIFVTEQKTRKPVWRKLTRETSNAVELCIGLKPNRELIWEGYAPKGAYKAFRRLAERAKQPGTSKYVRRGAASELEARNPGQGWRFLRHSIPQLFERHYRVGRICDRNPLRPPELD